MRKATDIQDKRIGRVGEFEPEVCAVTGQRVIARVGTAVHIGSTPYYYRVLNKAKHLAPETLYDNMATIVALFEEQQTPVVKSKSKGTA